MSHPISAADLVVLKQRYQEASAALHSLYTGKSVVTVRDSNGESITYQPANIWELAAYVKSLERQITGAHRPRPMFPML